MEVATDTVHPTPEERAAKIFATFVKHWRISNLSDDSASHPCERGMRAIVAEYLTNPETPSKRETDLLRAVSETLHAYQRKYDAQDEADASEDASRVGELAIRSLLPGEEADQ